MPRWASFIVGSALKQAAVAMLKSLGNTIPTPPAHQGNHVDSWDDRRGRVHGLTTSLSRLWSRQLEDSRVRIRD